MPTVVLKFVWTRGLMDIQKIPFSGNDLYLRLSYSDLGEVTCFAALITLD